jgi:hypothetical protein
VHAANFSSRIFVGLPIIFYGFSSHVNIFSIYRYASTTPVPYTTAKPRVQFRSSVDSCLTNVRELKAPSLAKATQVIAGNIIVAFVVYGTLGLFGYLAFLEKTDGNILENYSPENVPIQLGTMPLYGTHAPPHAHGAHTSHTHATTHHSAHEQGNASCDLRVVRGVYLSFRRLGHDRVRGVLHSLEHSPMSHHDRLDGNFLFQRAC